MSSTHTNIQNGKVQPAEASQLTIAVLSGGPSAEVDVSRSSAKAVVAALEQTNSYRVVSIELDNDAPQTLISLKPDVVFPALHGPPGEDGTVQGLLEMLGLPYVGSEVQPSAFAMDKAVAKALFRRAGLPVAEDRVYRADQSLADLGAAQFAADIESNLGTKIVIKPMQQGSALGVTPLPEGGDLNGALRDAFALGDQVLVEPFVVGREITVGVLDLHNQAPVAHPVIEIVTPDNQWYDYTNRYAAGASSHVVPAAVDNAVAIELQRIALKAHEVLGLRDLSRADFILPEQGAPVLLEVNTLPGMTPTSLYPDGAKALGLDFPQLLSALVESAARR